MSNAITTSPPPRSMLRHELIEKIARGPRQYRRGFLVSPEKRGARRVRAETVEHHTSWREREVNSSSGTFSCGHVSAHAPNTCQIDWAGGSLA
jgi:hypothetical protein